MANKHGLTLASNYHTCFLPFKSHYWLDEMQLVREDRLYEARHQTPEKPKNTKSPFLFNSEGSVLSVQHSCWEMAEGRENLLPESSEKSGNTMLFRNLASSYFHSDNPNPSHCT